MKTRTILWTALAGVFVVLIGMGIVCVWWLSADSLIPKEIEDVLASHPATAEEFFSRIRDTGRFGRETIGDPRAYAEKSMASYTPDYLARVKSESAESLIEWYPVEGGERPRPPIDKVAYVCGIYHSTQGLSDAAPNVYLILLSADKRILGWTTGLWLALGYRY